MIPFIFFFLSFFQIFAVYRMPGSQHVYEEPGFRHSLSNCQVGCFSDLICFSFVKFIYWLFHFIILSRCPTHRECINIVCETAGLKTVDKKRKVSFFLDGFFFVFIHSFIRLIYLWTSVTCHWAPPIPCSFLWRSGQSQALLPPSWLVYWFYWFSPTPSTRFPSSSSSSSSFSDLFSPFVLKPKLCHLRHYFPPLIWFLLASAHLIRRRRIHTHTEKRKKRNPKQKRCHSWCRSIRSIWCVG